MKINVVGASGQLGSKVVRSLLARGADPESVIASARSKARVEGIEALGVELRHADYDRPATLRSAFAGTGVLLLIPSLAAVEPRIVQHCNAVEAAQDCGVRRVVLVSFRAAQTSSRFLIAPYLLYAESKVRLSGMDWTILRNGMYLDPLADWAPALAAEGRLPYPVRHGRVAYVCRDDLARASAAACLQDGHEGQVYELTGRRAVSMPELASALTAATGQPIAFTQVSEGEFGEICRADGVPEYITEVLTSMYRAVDAGEFETVTDHVERLTGAPPEGVTEYLRRALRRG